MEFLEEEPRPRFFIQSSSSSSSSSSTSPQSPQLQKPFLLLCFSFSIPLFVLAIFFLQSQTLQFLTLWLSSSLLLAPFAPPSITGGDIRVGRGPILEFPHHDTQLEESNHKPPGRRPRSRKSENLGFGPDHAADSVKPVKEDKRVDAPSDANRKEEEEEEGEDGEERDWNDGDFDLLKKQMMKHPVGKARRWEIIGEAFKGKHKVDSVIKMAKALGENRVGTGDSYAQFLKNRKPLDKRVEDEMVENGVGLNWGSGEDIALLNALKAFPKDTTMRWEKIAAAVPGRSKAACMKRVAELKKGFRSSKADSEA